MTDKQIIIDGVNVSGCDFLVKEDDYCSYSGEYRGYKGQCGCSDEEMCKDHPNCFYKKALKQLKRKEQECEELKKKIKEIKNVLSISYDLWMYHIANGIGNSDNKNAIEALEDFSVAIRLLADTLGESEGYLSYSTNKSKIYEQKKGLLQKMNEVQL